MRLLSARSMAAVVAVLALFQVGMLVGQFLSSGRAVADPIGMSVNSGSSPRVTLSGNYTSGSWGTIYTVPTGYQFVITDIQVDGRDCSSCYDSFTLYNPDTGAYLWSSAWAHNWGNTDWIKPNWHSSTGIVIPASQRLQIKVWQGYNNVYTIVGFLAEP